VSCGAAAAAVGSRRGADHGAGFSHKQILDAIYPGTFTAIGTPDGTNSYTSDVGVQAIRIKDYDNSGQGDIIQRRESSGWDYNDLAVQINAYPLLGPGAVIPLPTSVAMGGVLLGVGGLTRLLRRWRRYSSSGGV